MAALQHFEPELAMQVSQSFPTQATRSLPDQHQMGYEPSQHVTVASSSDLGPPEDSPGLLTGLILASPQNALMPAMSMILPPMTPSLMNLYPEANERLPYQHQDSNPWGVLQPYINDETRGQGILGQDELVQYDTVYPDTDASYGNNFGDSWQVDSTYPYNSTPVWNIGEERPRRNSGKFGWLKLKAALWWGIFKPRPKPPPKRAYLEELED